VMAMGETPITTEESWTAALSDLGEKSAPLNVIRQGERLSITVRARKSLSLAPVNEEKADTKPEYYIGIYTNPVDEVLRSHLGLREDQVGLVVQGVMEDSPAAQAGLAAGDVLLAARDSSITSVDQLNDLIQVLQDTPTPFKIVRNRSEKSILITPGPRPPEEQEATEDALELWNVVPNLGERLSAHVVYQQGHPEVRIVDLGELKSMNGSLDARIVNPAVIPNEDHTAMAAMQKLQEQVIHDLNRLIEIQSKEQANSTGKQIEALTRQVEALSKAVEELRNSVSRSTPVPAESP
ncbi:MAG TPA: PDZ domain-containing protein, partial [Isosphaeraceae bacterium]|nr:PDZ domain-containing protein [Isosphaeraceae bacterium]